MLADKIDQSVRLEVSPDGMAAHLVLKPSFPRHMLNEPMCLGMLADADVQITPEVQKAIAQLLAQPPGTEQTHNVLLAQGTPPVDGKDGWLEWLTGPDASDADAKLTEGASRISHYERTAHVIVRTDQTIGVIHPATPCQDGRDIFGQAIPAKPGRDVNVKFDDTILHKPSGDLVSQISGLLDLSGKAPRVRSSLEIPGHVDFSTGNIDFPGKALIHGSVRDRFVVKTEGDLEVRGLIEAATIRCLRNLRALGGMAGRERGHVEVTGDLTTKYLDNFQGAVGGNLCVEREVINCELAIDGGILSPTCRIVGGKITVSGAVEVGQLGSAAGVTTTLVLGTMPKLETYAARLEKIIDALVAHEAALVTEQSHAAQFVTKPRANDRERQTEILFELDTVRRNLAKSNAVRSALAERIKARRTITLSVQSAIYREVVLKVNGRPHTVRNDVRGPVKLWCDAAGAILYERPNASARPLSEVADPGSG